MKRIVVLAAVVGWSLFYSDLAFSLSSRELSELKREIEALKAGQAAIQKDLTEIKNFILQRAPAPPPEAQPVVSIDGGAIKGDKTAKVTLVEFTDYQCPFCSRHFQIGRASCRERL